MIARTIAILLAAALAGCAAQRQMTREEWLATTTREYQDVKPEQVFAAAEKLFRLADGDDFVFSHTDDELYATRNWSVYVVLAAAFGTDYWRVRAVPTPKGTRVSVQANTQHQTIAPQPTSQSGGWSTMTTPLAGTPIQGTAIYDVFWARLDYLLGRRQDWMTCKEADERVSQGIVWGLNEALCNSFNVADRAPWDPEPQPPVTGSPEASGR